MAAIAVVARLAWHNLRRRPGTAMLLLVALTTATTTLTLALALDATAHAPWDRTLAATRGPDVLVSSGPAGGGVAALRDAAGVVASAGPWPVVMVAGEVGGRRQDVSVMGRAGGTSPLDQPLVTSGRWIGGAGVDGGNVDGGEAVVLERSFADALGVRVGDPVTLAGRRLRVRGIAITVTRSAYPLTSPGLAWVSSSVADRLAASATLRGSVLALRLADPAQAPTFAAQHSRPGAGPLVESWQELRRDALDETRTTRVVLLTTSALLALLTAASVGAVVAGRMAARSRQVGTLKAVGMTPAQVAAVLLLEHLALAAGATALGLVTGSRLAPVVARPAANLLAAPQTPGLRWGEAGLVAAAAALIVVLATVSPTLRGARQSTLRSLIAGIRPSALSLGIGRAARAARLPLATAIGIRSALRRPRQAMLAAVSLALATAMVIAALAMERTFQVQRSASDASGPSLPDAGVLAAAQEAADDRLRGLVYTLTALLLVLGAINTLVVASFAARDCAANQARLRAVGFTPRQSVTALVSSQTAVAIAAAVVGVPLGEAVFRLAYDAANSSGAGAALPPLTWVVAAVAGVTLATAVLASVPARIMSRRPVARALTYE